MTTAPVLDRPTDATLAPRPRRSYRTSLTRGQGRSGWLFLAPFGLFYVAFLLGPTIWMIVTSFFNTSTVRTGLGSFAGFANYAEMLGRSDFWSSDRKSVV